MTRELFWLTLTVGLTGLLWVPYMIDRMLVRGMLGAMANPSRDDKPQSPWAHRLYFAHTNAVDNIAVFAPLVLILNCDGLFDQVDRAGLRRLFLGAPRPRCRLRARNCRRAVGGLHRRLHRRRPCCSWRSSGWCKSRSCPPPSSRPRSAIIFLLKGTDSLITDQAPRPSH